MSDIRLNTIPEAVEALAAGRPIVVADDEDRENEGDLIFPAEDADTELLAFTVRYSSGYICVSLPAERADALQLPPAYVDNQDRHGTAYAVSVDAKSGVTTGISAADRAHTIATLAKPSTTPSDLTRPGHVVPLRSRPDGVLERPGHTEAAADLTRMAGKQPVAGICELVNDDGTMKQRDDDYQEAQIRAALSAAEEARRDHKRRSRKDKKQK